MAANNDYAAAHPTSPYTYPPSMGYCFSSSSVNETVFPLSPVQARIATSSWLSAPQTAYPISLSRSTCRPPFRALQTEVTLSCQRTERSASGRHRRCRELDRSKNKNSQDLPIAGSRRTAGGRAIDIDLPGQAPGLLQPGKNSASLENCGIAVLSLVTLRSPSRCDT